MLIRALTVFDMCAPKTWTTRPPMLTAARTAARAECQSSGNGRYVDVASTIGSELKIPTPSSCVAEQPALVHAPGAQCVAKTPRHARPVRCCNWSIYVANCDWRA